MQCSDVRMCGYVRSRVVGVWGSGGMLPQGKFEFLGYIRWYLRPLGPFKVDCGTELLFDLKENVDMWNRKGR